MTDLLLLPGDGIGQRRESCAPQPAGNLPQPLPRCRNDARPAGELLKFLHRHVGQGFLHRQHSRVCQPFGHLRVCRGLQVRVARVHPQHRTPPNEREQP